MLSHPTRVATASTLSRGSLLLAGSALILIALGTRLGSPPVEGAPAAAAVSTSAVSSAPAASPAAGCWVTGDLVGEGNPTDLATALCGQK